MPSSDTRTGQDTLERLLAYSAAAGLGAFAFAPEAGAIIVHNDIPDLVLNRGESLAVDFDNDTYSDALLLNTSGGGLGGYGTVQWRGTVYFGLPGSNPYYPNQGAGYTVTNTVIGSAYYARSFNAGEVIGPSNAFAQDLQLPPGYGLITSYGGYGQNSFWDDNEYAGIRLVDATGTVVNYGWARFKVNINDVTGPGGIGGPDGTTDQFDYWLDPNRTVTIYEYAYETTPGADILAGDVGSALEGDLNNDGFVGIADLNIVLGNWNLTIPPGDPVADTSGDNFVGIEDLNTVLGNWNAGTPPTASAVPEPTSLALLAVGAGALSFNRRRNK